MATIKLPQLTNRDINRFHRKIKVLPNGCWEWTASRERYGTFRIGDKIYRSHRISYFLHHGIDPLDKCVCHDCPDGDNSHCVNPEHLFLGTQAENVIDMHAKGRWRAKDQYGEKNAMAKLTANDIPVIREKCKTRTQRSVALEYGVVFQTINDIMRGKIWKHVT